MNQLHSTLLSHSRQNIISSSIVSYVIGQSSRREDNAILVEINACI